MIAIQSMLAATDFSADASHAVDRAALLQAGLGLSRGALLHVVESGWIDALRRRAASPEVSERRLLKDATRSLEQLAHELQRRWGVTLEPRVRIGKPLDVIAEAAAEFDLVTLGARGGHRLGKLTLGATAQRLLGKTRQPVLVVKRKPVGAYRRLLTAVDFSEHSSRAFAYSAAIAPQGAHYLVHAFEAPLEDMMISSGVPEESIEQYRICARREAHTEMSRFIEAAGLAGDPPAQVIEHGYAPGVLVDKARELAADLVVVGKHGRSRTEQLLLGSVTLHLLAECDCDVLVVQ